MTRSTFVLQSSGWNYSITKHRLGMGKGETLVAGLEQRGMLMPETGVVATAKLQMVVDHKDRTCPNL